MIPDEKRQKIRHVLDALPERVKDADSPLRATRQIDDATDAIIGIVFNAIAGDKPRMGEHGHSRASEAYASACAAVAGLLRAQAGVTDVDRLTGLSHDCVEAVLDRFPSTVASGPGYQNIFRAIETRMAAAERQGDAQGERDLAVLNVLARAMLTPVLTPTLEWLGADAIREALDAGPHAPIRVTPQSEMEAVQIIRGQPYGEGVNRGSGGPAEALEAETKAMAGGTLKPFRPGDTLSIKIGDAAGAGSAGGSSPTRHIPPVGWTVESFMESGLYKAGYRLHATARRTSAGKWAFTPPGVVFPPLTAYIHDSAYQAALAAADHDIARERERLIVEEPAPAPWPAGDGWITWQAGMSPVDARDLVMVRLRNGVESQSPCTAGSLCWTLPVDAPDAIVAYRVVEPLRPAAPQPAPDEEPISAADAPEPVVELATHRFVVVCERVEMDYDHFIDRSKSDDQPGTPFTFTTIRFPTRHTFQRGDLVTVTYDAASLECRHVAVEKITLK